MKATITATWELEDEDSCEVGEALALLVEGAKTYATVLEGGEQA